MNIQLIIVLAAFGLAVFFLVRRIVHTITHKKTSGCADCGGSQEAKKAVK